MIDPKHIHEKDFEFIVNQPLPWKNLEGKVVLVTGASGMIASRMVEVLLYLNKKVFTKKSTIYAVVRDKGKALQRFDQYVNDEHLNIIVGDVSQPLSFDKKVDVIIHAASQASPIYFGKDPVGTLLPNVVGTYHLLELARRDSVDSFLFISSGEVYGEVTDEQVPIKETTFGYIDINNLRACYSESKRMGETMCVSWFHQFGVPVKIVRPFHIYGYGLKPHDGRVFGDFIFDIVNRRDIVMKSDGQVKRSFCYLADAVAGFFTVLLKGELCSVYNVGNDTTVITIIDLANRLVTLFPERDLKVIKKERILSKGYLQSSVISTYPDITKIKQLGWKPVFSIEEGFTRAIESIES